MTRPVYEPSLERTDAALGFGSDQLFRRPRPSGAPTFPWAILRDGYIEHNGDGTSRAGGFFLATKFYDDADQYFSWDVTQSPDYGGYTVWYLTLTLETEGIYLFDSVCTWESWATGGGAGVIGKYSISPTNSFDPYGLGQERFTWNLQQEWSTGSPWMRVSGIMSANAGCRLPVTALQNTGTIKIVALNYLKAVYLESHGDPDNWTVDMIPIGSQ